MPLLVRFLIRQTVIGVAVAVLFVAALMGLNVGQLGMLMRASPLTSLSQG